MKLKQLHKNIGISIENVNLANIDEIIFKEIQKLWMKNLIIVFPNQNISDEDHINFGKKFGKLEVHPSLSHRSSKNPEIYRVSNVDEKGKIINGDQIIAMLAKRWKSKKILKGGVVGTLMSNYGLEKFLKKENIPFIRSKVGDRYVKEKMKKLNFNLGGEQSGHIILGKFATTGDGLLVALEVLF